jgi:uncharacterized OB-fold protein
MNASSQSSTPRGPSSQSPGPQMPGLQAQDSRLKTNPHVFVLEGEATGAPGLRAVRCGNCSEFSLGRPLVCGYCLSRNLTPQAAGQTAELLEFAVSNHPAGGFEAPYAIGFVSTTERLTLFAPLVGEPEGFARGVRLRFVLLDRENGRVAFAYALDEASR